MRGVRDGREVAEDYVRAHCSGMLVILASVQAAPISEHSPFDAFFIRPFRPEDVAAWIKRHHTTTTPREDIRIA
jgi:hypothetical protein